MQRHGPVPILVPIPVPVPCIPPPPAPRGSRCRRAAVAMVTAMQVWAKCSCGGGGGGEGPAAGGWRPQHGHRAATAPPAPLGTSAQGEIRGRRVRSTWGGTGSAPFPVFPPKQGLHPGGTRSRCSATALLACCSPAASAHPRGLAPGPPPSTSPKTKGGKVWGHSTAPPNRSSPQTPREGPGALRAPRRSPVGAVPRPAPRCVATGTLSVLLCGGGEFSSRQLGNPGRDSRDREGGDF